MQVMAQSTLRGLLVRLFPQRKESRSVLLNSNVPLFSRRPVLGIVPLKCNGIYVCNGTTDKNIEEVINVNDALKR